MKLKLIPFLFIAASSFGQLKVTNEGKEIKEISCEMNDLKMTMPVPTNFSSYDKIKITIGQYLPDGGLLYQYIYDTEFNASYFEGKSQIKLMLLNPEGKSDLWKGWYLYYNLSDACFDGNREFTDLENIISIWGGKHNGWEFKDGEQVKKYSYDKLKTYSINHKIGPVTNNFYGPRQYYVIDKFKKGESVVDNYDEDQYVVFNTEVNDGSGNDVMDMGGPAPKAKTGTVYLVSKAFTSEESSVEKIKKGLEFLLIRQANPNFTVNGTDIPFDHNSNFRKEHFFPAVIGGAKKDESKEKSNSGGLGKLKKLTGGMISGGNSGPSKDEVRADIEKMVANSGDYFNWETKVMDGVYMQYLELEVYEKDQMKSYDSGAKYVKAEEKENSKLLRFYIGEKNGKIVAISIFKSKVAGLTANEKEFIENFDSTFKWNI
ncbi:MAG: hypothetical protein ABJG68_07400 [Crocinitomicaceae bacterium]